MLVLIISLLVTGISARTLTSFEETPKGCEWQMQPIEENQSAEEPVLSCQIRTVSNADTLLSNLTKSQADRVTALKLECSDVLFFESSLDAATKHSNFLSSLRRLKELRIEYCKIRSIPATALSP